MEKGGGKEFLNPDVKSQHIYFNQIIRRKRILSSDWVFADRPKLPVYFTTGLMSFNSEFPLKYQFNIINDNGKLLATVAKNMSSNERSALQPIPDDSVMFSL